LPDLQGYVANGMTLDGTETLIREAMTFHIKDFQTDGQLLLPSNSEVK
jgi:predicted RNase H-like HicB family nuclease